MSKVVLFSGRSQYDSTRFFIDQLAGGLRSLGRETVIVDLIAPDAAERLEQACTTPVFFFFSFNHGGAALATPGKSIFEMLKAPLVTALVDHPMHHIARLRTEVDNVLLGCMDITHVPLVQEYSRGEQSVFFFPHFALEAGPDNVPAPAERDIDVLLAGFVADSEQRRSSWLKFQEPAVRLLNEIARMAMSREGEFIEDLLAEHLASGSLFPNRADREGAVMLLTEVDSYVRERRRELVLVELAEAGIPVDIYGQAAETRCTAGHRLHGPVKQEQAIGLVRRAKVVLQVGPGYPCGIHERVLSAMMNGAVVVTDQFDDYWSKEFADGQDLVRYRFDGLKELPGKVRALLDGRERRAAIACSAGEKVRARHTAEQRAKHLVDVVSLFKVARAVKPVSESPAPGEHARPG